MGSVYVAGYTAGSLGGPNAGGYDAFLTKFNDEGQQLWTRQFGGATFDFASGVATDGMGNVFVAGWRELPSAVDAFVRKYDLDGNLLWNRQIGTVEANADIYDIASDAFGNIYVAGRTAGSLGAANAGGFDAFARKYDSAGNIHWTYQLGTPAYDGPAGITLDGRGNVILSGGTRGNLGGPVSSTSGDAWVALLREQQVPAEPMPLAGDYDASGLVEQADLDLVLLHWGSDLVNPVDAGWISDLPQGPIDQTELDKVLLNWGTSSAVTAASVPEPASWALVGVGLIAAGWERRRRFRKKALKVIRQTRDIHTLPSRLL